MKQIVAQQLENALKSEPGLAEAAAELSVIGTIERTRDPAHGDFASNIAMRLAKPMKKSPRDIAASLVEALAAGDDIDQVDVAGPGFINFHLSPSAFHSELATVLHQGSTYGTQPKKQHPKILLEFVSANPTGPLHVGHGRHGAYGATVGNLLEAVGYPVHREYYVNDAGRQMDILGISVWLRLLESKGIGIPFPTGGYRGDYIKDIAEAIDSSGVAEVTVEAVMAGLPADAPEGDKEAYVEALILSLIHI